MDEGYIAPCPFCGNTHVEAATDTEIECFENGEGTGYYAVVCPFNEDGCGATGGYRETKEEAIVVWNERV